MRDLDDTDRTLGDLVRLGTVASVDLAGARLTIRTGDLVTGPIPWLALAANSRVRLWSPPRVGEQALLICPEGEVAAGVALLGVYSTVHAAPASDDADSIHFADGTVLRYDSASSQLSAVLGGGGKIELTAPGGVTITGPVLIDGDLAVTGKVDAEGDVTGDGVSLHEHKHLGVQAGSAVSGKPQ